MSKKRASEYLKSENPFTGELEALFFEDATSVAIPPKTSPYQSINLSALRPPIPKDFRLSKEILEASKTLRPLFPQPSFSSTDNRKPKINRESISAEKRQHDIMLSKQMLFLNRFISNLLGISVTSAAFQPLLTSIAAVEYGRHLEVPYKNSIQNFWDTNRAWKIARSKGMFQHRLQTSILPASFVLSVGQEYEPNSGFLTALHISLIAGIANIAQRDADLRFNAINGKKYSFLGVNLPSIKSFEEFESYASRSEQTSNFNQDDWGKLSARINIMKENMPLYKAVLAFRTIIFSAAVFISKPLAKKLNEEFGDEIAQKYNISKETIENTFENGIFASLAQVTTSMNRGLTLLASGKYNAQQVYQKIEHDLLHGPNRLVSGAMARIAFCFAIASSFNEGIKLGDTIRESIHDLFEPEKERAQNPDNESIISRIKKSLEIIITKQEEYNKDQPSTSVSSSETKPIVDKSENHQKK